MHIVQTEMIINNKKFDMQQKMVFFKLTTLSTPCVSPSSLFSASQRSTLKTNNWRRIYEPCWEPSRLLRWLYGAQFKFPSPLEEYQLRVSDLYFRIITTSFEFSIWYHKRFGKCVDIVLSFYKRFRKQFVWCIRTRHEELRIPAIATAI